MARVNDGSHNFTCHSHVYSLEWAVLPFIPQPKSITARYTHFPSRYGQEAELACVTLIMVALCNRADHYIFILFYGRPM